MRLMVYLIVTLGASEKASVGVIWMPSWSEEELAAQLKANPDLTVIDMRCPTPTENLMRVEDEVISLKPTKYHSQPTEYKGVRYQSKKEAVFAEGLDYQKAAGVVKFWLRQVPFDLPGRTTYRLDFMAFYPNGTYRLFRVKGKDRKTGRIVTATSTSQMKERQVEELYGVSIELV